jgi:hypothetical protein
MGEGVLAFGRFLGGQAPVGDRRQDGAARVFNLVV